MKQQKTQTAETRKQDSFKLMNTQAVFLLSLYQIPDMKLIWTMSPVIVRLYLTCLHICYNRLKFLLA